MSCTRGQQHRSCTSNADDLVAVAMEELRQEAKRGEKKTEAELAWILSYSIAAQHVHKQNEHMLETLNDLCISSHTNLCSSSLTSVGMMYV